MPGKSSYFTGCDPRKWRTNVANYRKVLYRNVYPGIDVVYYGSGQNLEHDFIVRPGANPQSAPLIWTAFPGQSLSAVASLFQELHFFALNREVDRLNCNETPIQALDYLSDKALLTATP